LSDENQRAGHQQVRQFAHETSPFHLPLYGRALAIWEKALDPERPGVATCMENYASLLRNMSVGRSSTS